MKEYKVMLKDFKTVIKSEKGAVEFIETSIVFSIIFFLISMLLIITLFTINKITYKEQNYMQSLDILNNQETDNSRIVKSKGLIFTKASLKDDSKTVVEKRINTHEFLRKIDLSKDIVNELAKLKINGKSISSIVDRYINSAKKLGDILK
ncbi:MAG: hypothetical protein GXZ08_02165 [Tissierellia bacterium]|nr:hypothetical protein [Tissierellia bacterium]